MDQRPRPMFRLLLPNSGVSYHDLLLVRHPVGSVAFDDFSIRMCGELFAQTFRRLYFISVARSPGRLLGRLLGVDQKSAQFFATHGEMDTAFQAGNFIKIIELY